MFETRLKLEKKKEQEGIKMERLNIARILTLIVIIGVLTAFSCQEKEVVRQPTEQPQVVPAQGEFLLPREDLMECLVNKFGIRRKVIIKKKGVRCSAEPGEVESGPELKYFYPYFVFAEVQKDNLIYYEIGITPRKMDNLGWVSSRNAQCWDTRIGDRYLRLTSQNKDNVRIPPLYIYQTKEDLIKAIKGEKVEPIAQAAYKYEYKTLMAWPIVEKDKFSFEGKIYELHQIAFLGEYKGGADITEEPESTVPVESIKQKEIEKIEAKVRMLDIVFVIDSTNSMQPYIDQAREAVKTITLAIKNFSFQPDIAFGMVEYRDYVDGLYFADNKVYRRYPLTSNVPRFLTSINAVTEADISSVDWPEAVFDGVKAALTETDWRGAGLSERVIILIGDNSGHPSTCYRNPNRISVPELISIAQQKDKHVTIFSLCAKNRSDEEIERKIHLAQFTELAESTGGKCFPLSEAPKIIPLVEKIVQYGAEERILPRAKVLEVYKPGVDIKKREAILKELGDYKVTEVVQYFANAGVDLANLAPGETAFSTGWVVTESAGFEILQKETYLARTELSTLISNLEFLREVLHDPRMLDNLRKGSISIRTEGLFFGKEESPIPIDVRFMTEGIPVGENSVLRFTEAEIQHMPEGARREIAYRISRFCVPELLNERNDLDRFPETEDIMFGWVREAFLP